MSTAIYTFLSMPILLGIASLALDFGLIVLEKSKLQLAADAAAIAAAEYLGDENDISAIRNEAVQISSGHLDFDSVIESNQVTVEVGDFSDDGSFYLAEDGAYVRVTIENRNLPIVFGSLFGYSHYEVSSSAVAGKVSALSEECVPTTSQDWPCLLFAQNGLELTGNFDLLIDSSLDNASACTNAASITLGGSLYIQDGIDLHMGPDCQYSNGTGCIDSNGGAYHFQGDTTPMGLEFLVPSVEYPDDYEALPNGVRVGGRNGGTVTNLALGETYFIDGNFSTANNQSINILNSSNGCLDSSGQLNPTVIYVNGNVSLNGGVSGNVNHPECFEIRVIGERTVRINGRSAFYGSIYAPDSEVYPNGNANFYGTIVADTLRANGNNDIILSSRGSSSVPNVGDEVICEEDEIEVLKMRLVQ